MIENKFNPDWMKAYELTRIAGAGAIMAKMRTGKWYRVEDVNKAIMEKVAEYQEIIAAKDKIIDAQEGSMEDMHAEIEIMKLCGSCRKWKTNLCNKARVEYTDAKWQEQVTSWGPTDRFDICDKWEVGP